MLEAKHIRYDTGRIFMESTPWLIAGAVILILLVSLLAHGNRREYNTSYVGSFLSFEDFHRRRKIRRAHNDQGNKIRVRTAHGKFRVALIQDTDAGIPVRSEGDFMQPDPPPGPKKSAR